MRAGATLPGIDALRRKACHPDGAITVLMYHSLGDDDEVLDAWTVARRTDFLRQMAFVRRHYELVGLDEALARSAQRTSGGKPLAVVTFDDGHTSLPDLLLPIVRQEGLPVTVYLATGHIESGQAYWFDRVVTALQTEGPLELDLRDAGLGLWHLNAHHGAENWSLLSALMERLKLVEAPQRDAIVERIERQVSALRRPRFAPLRPMRPDDVRGMAEEPLVTIGAHSHCHRLLDRIPLEEARDSMDTSRRLLEQWSSRQVVHFAYPNGNHNPALVRLSESMGFRSAVTTRKGICLPGESRHAMRRIPVGRYDDMTRFRYNLLYGHTV